MTELPIDPVGLWILLIVCAVAGVAEEAVRRSRRGDQTTVASMVDTVLTGMGLGLSLALVLFVGAAIFIRAGV